MINHENKLIDYLGDDTFKLGLVHKHQNEKLQVEDLNGRQERIALRQVLGAHGGASGDWGPAARTLQARLLQVQSEIDTELLWESLAGREREFSVGELCEEYFSEAAPTLVQQGAMARALVLATRHFKRKGLAFTPRGAAEVAQVQQQQAREAARAAARTSTLAWLKQEGRGQAALTVPAAQEDFFGLLAAFMHQGHHNDAEKLLQEALPKADPRQVGLDLLERAGRLGPDTDPFLLLNGVTSGFSEAVLRHTAALPAFTPDRQHADYTALPSFTIDDDDTREVDDAITVESVGDALVVGIHIADPAAFVHKGDPLDRVAADRPLTLYLPTTVVTMMPERLGCDLASLNLDTIRPTLSFRVVVAPDGTIRESAFGRAQIRVARRLNYEQADTLLTSDPPADAPPGEAATAAALRQLLPLATRWRQARLDTGALVLLKPELKVRVAGGVISIKPVDSTTPSHLIVSELMILANRLAAEYALSHDVPFIYRTQDPAPEPIPPMTGYDPVAFDRAVRMLRRTRLTTAPQRHAALGLDVYSQISSPIRRYGDLVLQRQLAAHLAGDELPYTGPELVEVLARADNTEQQNRRLEREATRYWILEYLRRNCLGQAFDGTVLDDGTGGRLVELDTYGVRGRLTTPAPLPVGARVHATLTDVDARRGWFTLKA